jgi:mannobiose 2-epimerase
VYQQLNGNILPFWQTQAIDSDFGGYVGLMDINGEVEPMADKSAIAHARILWSFSAAYRAFNKSEYLCQAKRAYQCLVHRFIDPEFGGVFSTVSFDGRVQTEDKNIVAQAYAIYALCGYYQATSDEQALIRARGIAQKIELHAFDQSCGGYRETLSRQWMQQSNEPLKLTAQVHIHLLEAYTALLNCQYDKVISEALSGLIGLFIKSFIDKNDYHVVQGEGLDNQSTRRIIFGHDLELSWLLPKAAKALDNPIAVEQCQHIGLQMVDKVIESHAHAPNQGIRQGVNLTTSVDVQREGWIQAEALSAFGWAYKVTGNQVYRQWLENSWDFIVESIVDYKLGDWHGGRNPDGTLVANQVKIGPWRCPYHSVRGCLFYYQLLSAELGKVMPTNKQVVQPPSSVHFS